jgi:hypothetical protein
LMRFFLHPILHILITPEYPYLRCIICPHQLHLLCDTVTNLHVAVYGSIYVPCVWGQVMIWSALIFSTKQCFQSKKATRVMQEECNSLYTTIGKETHVVHVWVADLRVRYLPC